MKQTANFLNERNKNSKHNTITNFTIARTSKVVKKKTNSKKY